MFLVNIKRNTRIVRVNKVLTFSVKYGGNNTNHWDLNSQISQLHSEKKNNRYYDLQLYLTQVYFCTF
jgi:hypothetical protein